MTCHCELFGTDWPLGLSPGPPSPVTRSRERQCPSLLLSAASVLFRSSSDQFIKLRNTFWSQLWPGLVELTGTGASPGQLALLSTEVERANKKEEKLSLPSRAALATSLEAEQELWPLLVSRPRHHRWCQLNKVSKLIWNENMIFSKDRNITARENSKLNGCKNSISGKIAWSKHWIYNLHIFHEIDRI